MKTHRRRTIRLRNYDYRLPGAYFVTVCTRDRAPLLSTVDYEGVKLTACGEIVRARWLELPDHFDHVRLDAFVAMPDHVHGILFLTNDAIAAGGTDRLGSERSEPRVRAGSLGAVVRAFKAASTRQINLTPGSQEAALWQRGYWDRVLRDEDELYRARLYIEDNPRRWLERMHEDP